MAHIHEKIDFCTDTYIVNNDAVLLRMHEKYKVWLTPGGHIELDEDPVQSALREVEEETGLKVTFLGQVQNIEGDKGKNLLAPRFINRHFINDIHEHISFIYFAMSKSREVVPQEGEVQTETRWFTKKELADPQFGVPPAIQYYAKVALEAAKK